MITSKSKNIIIHIDVYAHDLMVSIGESDETLFKKLISKGVDASETINATYSKTGQGKFNLFTSGQTLIRIKGIPKTPKQYGYLHHEIFHAASALLWRLGFKLKINTSDEAYAYLIQYLTHKIYKQF